jgi:hemerythrin-like domain-containing protein
MTNAVDFFRNFADGCHHSKEEQELFPTLVGHGIPEDGGPIGVMLAEHASGRRFLRGMAAAAERYAKGDAGAKTPLVTNALGYIDLLRAHIDKENHILFAMADQVLSTSEQARLYSAFDRIEKEHIGPGVHERYHAMIGEYQKTARDWDRVTVV